MSERSTCIVHVLCMYCIVHVLFMYCTCFVPVPELVPVFVFVFLLSVFVLCLFVFSLCVFIFLCVFVYVYVGVVSSIWFGVLCSGERHPLTFHCENFVKIQSF